MIDRPSHLDSCTVKARTGCGNIYIHVSWMNSQPFEVFLNMGAQGNCLSTKAGALGKTISVALRQHPSNAAKVLEEIASHLVGARCSRPCQNINGSMDNLSCEDAIGKTLLNLLATTDSSRKPSVIVPLNPESGAKTEILPPTVQETTKKIVPSSPEPSSHQNFGPCPTCHIGTMVSGPGIPCPTCDNPKCHYKECS